MNAGTLLEHLKIVQQTRELTGAVRAFAGEGDTSRALKELKRVTNRLARKHEEGANASILTQSEAEVTKLVLQDIENSESFPSGTSPEADSLLDFVRDLAFGEKAGKLSLMTLVFSQSYEQAVLARDLCLVLTKLLLLPSNCFSMLQMAEEYSLTSLSNFSKDFARQDFAAAAQADAVGFASLAQHHLMDLLSSDDLQVSSELDVFRWVAKWVQERVDERDQHLSDLLRDGVRLELMDRGMLFEVDAHPLIARNQEACRLVANTYIDCCYGGLLSGDATKAKKRYRAVSSSFGSPCQPSIASCCPTSMSSPESVECQHQATSRLPEGGPRALEVVDRTRAQEADSPDPGGWHRPAGRGAACEEEAEDAASSCARQDALLKRRRDWPTPGRLMSPTIRVRRSVARASLGQLDVEQHQAAPVSGGGTKLPSKRRLFE